MIPRPSLPAGPPRAPRTIDPDAPTGREARLFDLPFTLEESRVVVVPVPYEATVSGGPGTIDAPALVVDASRAIDLLDPWVGEPWRAGIALLPDEPAVRALSLEARDAVRRARSGDARAAAEADACGERLAAWLESVTGALLATGRTPILLGGEHAVAAGAIRAAAAASPGLGILQVDAHADLRPAYEGLRSSHASVMHRVLETPGTGPLVQVGLRDVAPVERRVARAAGRRVCWHTDAALARRQQRGETFAAIARDVVRALPDRVWVTFDVDGLDPSLCPRTGTPVPGGLAWREACALLAALRESGRSLAGADVVETGPAPWDALVAARLLYLLAGVAVGTAPE